MRLFRSHLVARGALVCALFAATACGEDEPSTPSTIVGVPGQTVAGRAGEVVPVTVRVAASNGRTLEGQTVTFSIGGGGGSVSPATVTTDAAGQAQTNWTLGNSVGTQTLNATVGSVTPLTISATVTAGRPATIAVQGGNNQTAQVGSTVATRPSVIVRDAGGNPVAGANVVFNVQSGGGSVTGAVVQTDAAGVATVGSFQLGPTAGPNTLVAQVVDAAGGQPLTATITATGTAGTASRIATQQGTGITAAAGSSLGATNLPAVVVTDANGNPVAGVAVTFSVTSGGGTVTGATATTNAQGIATVGGFTLGQTAGNNIITATAPGAGATVFTIVGQAGPAARAELVGGNNQEARAGSALPAAPTVRVVDQFGNPVAGATVTFAITSGGGAVLGATQTTNAQGIAAAGGVNLGPTPGPNTFEARIAGLSPVQFTATGLAGAPATLVRVSTADTVRVVAFATSAPFTVEVRDAAGFPVRGTTVNFALDSAKAGTLNPTSATTDAQGRASTRLAAAAVVDTATITATVAGLTSVEFTVVVAQNSAGTVTVLQGAGQSATIGTFVGTPPGVVVRDAAGNPVVGVNVNFSLLGTTSSGGSANVGGLQQPVDANGLPIGTQIPNGIQVPTNAQGRAVVGGWQLSGTPGENILVAIVEAPNVSGNPIRFTATGVAAPTNAQITIFQGDNQTASAGNFVPTQPAVLVRNASGTPLANVTIQFLPSGNGIVNPTFVQTDANGIARTSWRLATTAGPNQLTAAIVGTGQAVTLIATGQ